ncbi:hypothetical protein [Streptomyces sp. NPDC046712]|uniref:hypothetical protein n=1 Tax=Streptomyces sp. NPDC046712 TaxID=3154802 RepID=UPI0033D686E4
MFLAQLNFNESVGVAALNAAFTAILVGGFAALLVKRFEVRASKDLKKRDLEHQNRTALRETYAQLLVAQRRSREASVQLAEFRKPWRRRLRRRLPAIARSTADVDLEEKVQLTHDEFIETYHRLNLDADEQMWRDVRALREVLDHMRDLGKKGEAKQCRALRKTDARNARQNLERSFRVLLDHDPLQDRKPINGKYDKGEVSQAPSRSRFAMLRPASELMRMKKRNQSAISLPGAS